MTGERNGIAMTDYDKSRWADKEFAAGYADNADNIIHERRRLNSVLKSFYGHFLHGSKQVKVLDLGCGDGTLTAELTDGYPNIKPTLVDGSPDMLGKAKERLALFKGAEFVNASFQDMLAGGVALGRFDFIFSSLAIHHLDSSEKAALFGYIREHLEDGGYFLNIDVVLPPDGLEGWYLGTWRDWMDERRRLLGLDNIGEDMVKRYKDNEDNKPDTLGTQLAALKEAGYRDVDCYYKYGIFAVYGGSR